MYIIACNDFRWTALKVDLRIFGRYMVARIKITTKMVFCPSCSDTWMELFSGLGIWKKIRPASVMVNASPSYCHKKFYLSQEKRRRLRVRVPSRVFFCIKFFFVFTSLLTINRSSKYWIFLLDLRLILTQLEMLWGL